MAVAHPEQVISHDISICSEDAAKPSFPSYFDRLRELGFPPAVCVKGCATAVKAEFIRTWGWPDAEAGVSHDFWIALLATAFRQRLYIAQPLVEHRLHASNASGWIVSDADRVGSARWSGARRRSQIDQDLLIELCIKRWNLHWTDEFVRVLGAPKPTRPGNSSVLIGGLLENRRSYSSFQDRLKRYLFWKH